MTIAQPPLVSQLVDVPLTGGLSEGTDPRQLGPGGLLIAENVVSNQRGAFEKRPGFGRMSRTVDDEVNSLPLARKLDTVNDEIVALGEQRFALGGRAEIFSYAPTRGQWARKSHVSPCTITRRPATRSQFDQQNQHLVAVGGYHVFWWMIGDSGLFCRVVDPSTGAVVMNDTQVHANIQSASLTERNHLAAFACGDLAVAVFMRGVGPVAALAVTVFDTTTLRLHQPPTHIDMVDGVPVDCRMFDACPIDSSSFAVRWMRYPDPGFPEVIRTAKFSIEPSTEPAHIELDHLHEQSVSPVQIDAVAIESNGAQTFGFSHASSGMIRSVHCDIYTDATWLDPDSGGDSTLDFVSVDQLAPGIDSDGNCLVLIDGNPKDEAHGSPRAVVAQTFASDGSGLVGTHRIAYYCRASSRPFSDAGRMYAVLVVDASVGTPAYTNVLCCVDMARNVVTARESSSRIDLVGVVARYVGIWPTQDEGRSTPVRRVVRTSERVYLFPASVSVSIDSAVDERLRNHGTDIVRMAFGQDEPQGGLWQTAQAHGVLAMTGCTTELYDGTSVVESSFVQAPRFEAQIAEADGGAGLDEGNYSYVAHFEWTDSKGTVHRSALSAPMLVTTTEDRPCVEFTFERLTLTRRGDAYDGAPKQATIQLYRTMRGSSGPFYRLTNRTAAWVTTKYDGNSHIVNDREGVPVALHTDRQDDETVRASGRGFVYTDGGVLESQCAPPSTAIVSHRNRWWLASGEDGKRVYFSKIFTPGEAPEFNEVLSVRCDDSPDDVVALGSLDDKLVILTGSRVYVVVGDGPDDTGFNGSFAAPTLVTSNAGCVDARSVVSFAGGVAFMSQQGLCVLGRDLVVSFFGANVRTTVPPGTSFTALAHDVRRSRIHWLVPIDGRNRIVTFDYTLGVWSTATIAGAKLPYSLALWRGRLVMDTYNATLLEGAGDLPGYDDGYYPRSRISTPWIRLGAIGGYQRVWRVFLTAARKSPHRLRLSVYTNFDDTLPKQSKEFDLAEMSDIRGLPVMRLTMHLRAAIQKCSAIRIEISDTGPHGGEGTEPPYQPDEDAPITGFSLTGITLELGVKQGLHRLPVPNRS